MGSEILRRNLGMKKALFKWDKIIITAAIVCVLSVCFALNVPCLFHRVTSLPCLTCGMTRAWISLLSFDFAAAFGYHQLFWTVPILYIFFWFDGKVFKKKAANLAVLFGILGAFVIRWIIILVSFFIK